MICCHGANLAQLIAVELQVMVEQLEQALHPAQICLVMTRPVSWELNFEQGKRGLGASDQVLQAEGCGLAVVTAGAAMLPQPPHHCRKRPRLAANQSSTVQAS